MLTDQEYASMQASLATPASYFATITPEKFSEAISQAIEKLEKTSEANSNGNETLEDCQDAGEVLRLVMNVFDIAQDQVLAVRPLTVGELKLLGNLDKVIGRTAHRVARYAKSIQAFQNETNSQQLQ
jgi:hypothetical protein